VGKHPGTSRDVVQNCGKYTPVYKVCIRRSGVWGGGGYVRIPFLNTDKYFNIIMTLPQATCSEIMAIQSFCVDHQNTSILHINNYFVAQLLTSKTLTYR